MRAEWDSSEMKNNTMTGDYRSQYESDTWKRQLDFMSAELLLFQRRIYLAMKAASTEQILRRLESYLERFMRQEQLIKLLRDGIARLEQTRVLPSPSDPTIAQKLDVQLQNLRTDMDRAEILFGRLKQQFNQFLTEELH